MKIQDLFESGNPNNPGRAILSFEVFPPKRDLPIESIYGQLSSLCALKPDFISVTYGAGGKGNDNRTAEIAARIRHNYGVESVAHLTCVSNTKEDVDRITEELRMNNIENILALRGDLPDGVECAEDFAHAMYDTYMNFDTEEHVNMWLNAKESGTSGVPDVVTLVHDAEAIEKWLEQLSLAAQRVADEVNLENKAEEA